MELMDYIKIFKKQERVFWTTVFLCVFVAIVWQKNQPIEYQATLLLNIGRTGSPAVQSYFTYDSFYRLQADERFADTVVRWLGSPRVVEDIYSAAGSNQRSVGLRDLKGAFGAKRLSSQMIEVTYTDQSSGTLQKISEATVAVLNRYADSLNQENKETNWFVVIGSDPVIHDARVPFTLAVAVGLVFGIFIGFWMAIIRHYLKGNAHRD